MKKQFKSELLASDLDLAEEILQNWEAKPALLVEWINEAPESYSQAILKLAPLCEEEPFKAHQGVIHK